MLFEGALSRLDRGVDLVGDVALVRAPLQVVDAAFTAKIVGEPQRTLEVRRRLPVCTELRRAVAGSRRVLE
jgi:hypothetical protein